MLAGEKIAALAVTEPGAGSDVANLRTSARRDGDYFVVDGEKAFITSGMRADYLTVAVRTGGPGRGGISLLLVEGTTSGLSRTPLRKMGWWASDTAMLQFDNCRVPAEHLIGTEGAAFGGIAMTFNDERLGLAASAIGFAEVAYEEALAHAKLRHTFGKPLIQHQVIRHKLVDMRQRIAASQAFLELVAWQMDQKSQSGRGYQPAQEPGDPDAGLLRRGSGADLRRLGLHPRREGREDLPRSEGLRDRWRRRGDHEGARLPAARILIEG